VAGGRVAAASKQESHVSTLTTLTAEEQSILDGLFAKAALPGYDPALDTNEEERRVAAKYITYCLQELAKLGVRSHVVTGGRDAG
jgi:hypothetical protein